MKCFSVSSDEKSQSYYTENEEGNYICSLGYNDLGDTLCATDSYGVMYLNDVERNKIVYKEAAST